MPMHAERDIVMANPSVRPSVTLWNCIKTNTHIVKLFLPSSRGMILHLFIFLNNKNGQTATDMLIVKQNMMRLIATMNKTYDI